MQVLCEKDLLIKKKKKQMCSVIGYIDIWRKRSQEKFEAADMPS